LETQFQSQKKQLEEIILKQKEQLRNIVKQIDENYES